MVERFYTEGVRLGRQKSLADKGRGVMSEKDAERLRQANALQRDLASMKRELESVMADTKLSPDRRRDTAVPYLAVKMRLVAQFVGEKEPDWVTKALAEGEPAIPGLNKSGRPTRATRASRATRATR
jgi:hypothetical protein